MDVVKKTYKELVTGDVIDLVPLMVGRADLVFEQATVSPGGSTVAIVGSGGLTYFFPTATEFTVRNTPTTGQPPE